MLSTIILTWLDFWMFSGRKHCPMFEKKYHKNERDLRLVTYSFTKLSQIMCLINIQILIYQNARCNCKLWKVSWFYSVFWIFSYIMDHQICLNYPLNSTKLTQTVFLIDVHILVFSWLWKVIWFNAFFKEFSYIITYLIRYNFIKLS